MEPKCCLLVLYGMCSALWFWILIIEINAESSCQFVIWTNPATTICNVLWINKYWLKYIFSHLNKLFFLLQENVLFNPFTIKQTKDCALKYKIKNQILMIKNYHKLRISYLCLIHNMHMHIQSTKNKNLWFSRTKKNNLKFKRLNK